MKPRLRHGLPKLLAIGAVSSLLSFSAVAQRPMPQQRPDVSAGWYDTNDWSDNPIANRSGDYDDNYSVPDPFYDRNRFGDDNYEYDETYGDVYTNSGGLYEDNGSSYYDNYYTNDWYNARAAFDKWYDND